MSACLGWIGRTASEPELRLVERSDEGTYAPVEQHDALDLLARPNTLYGWPAMLRSIMTELSLFGNSYLVIKRDERLMVESLHWVSSLKMAPWGLANGPEIQYYNCSDQYLLRNLGHRILPEDVIHFRTGIDPECPYLGWSPFRSLLAEVFTDQEAATWVTNFLRNGAVPLMVISKAMQAGGRSPKWSQPDADQILERFEDQAKGNRIGSTVVIGRGLKVDKVGASAEDFDLTKIRLVPESRISGVLGVPPLLAGLLIGHQRANYANSSIARKLGAEQKIIPDMKDIAHTLSERLLPELEEAVHGPHFLSIRVRFLGNDRTPGGSAAKVGPAQSTLDPGRHRPLRDPRRCRFPDPERRRRALLRRCQIRQLWRDDAGAGIRSGPARAGQAPAGQPAQGTDAGAAAIPGPERRPVRFPVPAISTRDHEADERRTSGTLHPIVSAALEEIEIPKGAKQEDLTPDQEDAIERLSLQLAASMADALQEANSRLTRSGGGFYGRLAADGLDDIEIIVGHGIELSPHIEEAIVQRGGTRLGLVDFGDSTRQRVFKILTEGVQRRTRKPRARPIHCGPDPSRPLADARHQVESDRPHRDPVRAELRHPQELQRHP